MHYKVGSYEIPMNFEESVLEAKFKLPFGDHKVISGTVVDIFDNPIDSAVIEVYKKIEDNVNGTSIELIGHTLSDVYGKFIFGPVPNNITVLIKIFKSDETTFSQTFIPDNQSDDEDNDSNLDYVGPGKYETPLYIVNKKNKTEDEVLLTGGNVTISNTKKKFYINIETIEDWNIDDVRIQVTSAPIATSKHGNPKIGHFPYRERFSEPISSYELVLDIKEDLGVNWGQIDQDGIIENIVVYARLVKLNNDDQRIIRMGSFAYGNEEFPSKQGWWIRYMLSRPSTGHFIDAPVSGVRYTTLTNEGITDENGIFNYFPSETVRFSIGSQYIGSALANGKISPLDLVGTREIEDVRVINMAKLLQSLDVKGNPTHNISITEPVINCFHRALEVLNVETLDFSDSQLIDNIINKTVQYSYEIEGISLNKVSDDEAIDNLKDGIKGNVFRKNVSKTPEMKTAKAKIEIMPVYVPAFKANNDPVSLKYTDKDGNEITTRQEVKPLVVVYADEVPGAEGSMDVFAAISRDEGNTWKRKNLSRSADQSSFTLANGKKYFGGVKKPQCKIKGNKILVTWTSKYAKKGKPRYSIKPDDPNYENIYEEDIWGVSGSQKSIDYTELGYPEVGEIPFSCVWTCRGFIDEETGDITWFKAERLTSGRRDACQLMANGATNAGFAVTWQEDPEGLRPGEEAGPGEGWSGATTNHKTDIWYAYIKWDDFDLIDENDVSDNNDENDDDDKVGRPKVAVPFSLPVRISDNDVVNTDNMKLMKDEFGELVTDEYGYWIPETNNDGKSIGSHAYGYKIDNLCYELYEKENHQGEIKHICMTKDGRLLDGNTGASRPNVMLQPYTKDGKTSAWAILCYEETKGVGSGPPDTTATRNNNNNEDKQEGGESGKGQDRYYPDKGKNVIYHSFDFTQPNLVSAGTILNPQVKDENEEPVYLVDESGNYILDFNGDRIPAYENARRPRFIVQSKKKALEGRDEGTVLVCVFKMGEEGKGRPADIFMRRWRVNNETTGNPYDVNNMLDEIQNISSVTPVEIWEKEDNTDKESNRDPIKVLRWEQTEDNLNDSSWTNPYDDARAHRGFIRGDFLAIAYDWTPNWAAARNGNDVYNLYIRRSFDGGASWTTDPDGEGVDHIDIFKTQSTHDTHEKIEVETHYLPGEFEPARNVSQLRNTKSSVIEPRLVGTPGTIKTDGEILENDNQDIKSFWVTYGTEYNPGRHSEEEGYPMDIYYSYSKDWGETYYTVTKTIKEDGNSSHAGETVETWDWLAKDTGKKVAEQAECQIRMTPDGSIFYAVWNEANAEESDVMFRRIMRDGVNIEVIPREI